MWTSNDGGGSPFGGLFVELRRGADGRSRRYRIVFGRRHGIRFINTRTAPSRRTAWSNRINNKSGRPRLTPGYCGADMNFTRARVYEARRAARQCSSKRWFSNRQPNRNVPPGKGRNVNSCSRIFLRRAPFRNVFGEINIFTLYPLTPRHIRSRNYAISSIPISKHPGAAVSNKRWIVNNRGSI